MDKISYSIVLKNKTRDSAKWYGRIRQNGKERLIPISQVKAEAERWLRRVQLAYDEACDLEEHHEPIPVEITEAILTVDSTPVIARKRGSEGVLSLRSVVDRWEAKMRLEGKSERTISNYTRICREIFDLNLPLTSLNKDLIDQIMASKAHLKSASRRHVAEMLKVLVKFCMEEYALPGSTLMAIPNIKAIHEERPCWTREEMQRIIAEIEHPNESVQEQFKLYCTMLAAIGCRQGEGALVRWEDYKDGCITFRATTTKSRTARTVPVPFSVQKGLAKWLRPSGLIFDLIPTTQSGRYTILKRALDKLGLPGSLHTFRHSASTLLYKSCNDLKACSQVLGHDPATALRYYQQTRGAEELRRVVDVDLPSW